MHHNSNAPVSEKISEKSSIRIPVLRSSDLNPSIRPVRDEEIKIAFAPECSRTLPTSVFEKSGRIGTATAPIKVIAKYVTPQFGIFELRMATLSPGTNSVLFKECN